MATPGAIAVYTSGSGTPDDVRARPWRGVYHHYDGYPSGLGQELIKRVRKKRGDVAAVVRELIDEAPQGWSSCFDQGEKYGSDDPGLAVAPDDTGAVAFVYVFDAGARRLDAFAVHSEASGERIGSVEFSAAGEPDVAALDLRPEERVREPWLPGPTLSAADLLDALPELENIQWVDAAEGPEGSLIITFRVLQYEDGELTGVIERDWDLVPAEARREPTRVTNFLSALAEAVEKPDPFWLASLDPLRRTGARQRSTFVSLLQLYRANS